MLYAMWVFAGWCGTPYPWWLWLHPGPPPPGPGDPWPIIKIVSIIGGVIGGWMTQRIVGGEVASLVTLTTMAGAFFGGGFLGGLAGLIAGGRNRTAR
jgi:hypothetical protein